MKKKLYLLILFVIPAISCSLFTNENDGYEQALERWEVNKSINYEFSYRVGCFCATLTPALIVVNSDSIYQILDVETRDSLMVQVGESTYEYAGKIYKDSYKTIDELFKVIKDSRGAHELDVDYNEALGYPTSIYIDHIKNAVDDEIGYSVSNYLSTMIINH